MHTKADRLAFLIDARAYFQALASAMERARHSIFILGWDIHSGLRLQRGDSDGDEGLRDFLDRLVRRRADLRVYILLWDFNVLLAASREWLPAVRLGWATHARIDFLLDSAHAPGACQHEKTVIVDDELAFVGGIDLTARRWDTPAHAEHDRRRVDPHGRSYPPCHDVQVAVSGPVAALLGARARERWRRAGGDRDALPEARGEPRTALWPEKLEPDLTDVDVEIAITEGAHDGRPARTEIERAYREAIGSAESHVYIENQYLSSDSIREVIERVLQREEGPEVCIVVPRSVSGWLEDRVMGALRARVVKRLVEADRHDRLRVWFPLGPSDDGEPPIVHSKLCIVDDRFLTIGSANLSNRSMSLDTECNLVLRARPEDATARAVRELRERLLAEHAGVARETLTERIRRHGSVLRAVESLPGSRLRRLDPDSSEWVAESLAPVLRFADPETPLDWETLRGLLAEEG